MNKNLYRQATAMLRAAGYTAAGRPQGEKAPEQHAFEKRIISTPTGGKPGYRLKTKH
jgi:hypothetical protein